MNEQMKEKAMEEITYTKYGLFLWFKSKDETSSTRFNMLDFHEQANC